MEDKICELGEKESKERESLKEEFSARLDQRVGDLSSEVRSSRVGDLGKTKESGIRFQRKTQYRKS